MFFCFERYFLYHAKNKKGEKMIHKILALYTKNMYNISILCGGAG